MDVKDTITDVASFIWDLLTDDSSAHRFQQDPAATLAAGGHGGLSPEQFELAMDRVMARLPVERAALLPATLGAGATHSPAASYAATSFAPAAAPAAFAAAAAPAPQVVRHVTEQRVVHEHVTQQVANHVTNQITNNQRFVREGDVIVDNRVVTAVHAEGDVTLDQDVHTTTVVAGKGAVAVGGGVAGSAVNTGHNGGVLAGDDVDIDDAVLGDGNTQVTDGTVGALSGRGPATTVAGTNVTTGSGDVTAVEAGDDATTVHGDDNELAGDLDVDRAIVDAPTVAAGPAAGEGEGAASPFPAGLHELHVGSGDHAGDPGTGQEAALPFPQGLHDVYEESFDHAAADHTVSDHATASTVDPIDHDPIDHDLIHHDPIDHGGADLDGLDDGSGI